MAKPPNCDIFSACQYPLLAQVEPVALPTEDKGVPVCDKLTPLLLLLLARQSNGCEAFKLLVNIRVHSVHLAPSRSCLAVIREN